MIKTQEEALKVLFELSGYIAFEHSPGPAILLASVLESILKNETPEQKYVEALTFFLNKEIKVS